MQVFKFGGASVKDAAGIKNLAEIVKRYAHLPAAELRDKVITEVQAFAQNTTQHDDLTVVAVKVTT